ncbi:hypothetical protein ABW21_db0203884 [Orbilia brochopaga]|nr:hypothetical protein ABW21_db0203884 [Drechslerella brochopaga]
MESNSKKNADEMSIASATTASLHSALDYEHEVAIPPPAAHTPAPSSSPSMEYKRTCTGSKDYPYNFYDYNSERDYYPPSEPCEFQDPAASGPGENKSSTLGDRLRRSMASISHCVQASGWALCCCGCLPCTTIFSACTGRRQSWG